MKLYLTNIRWLRVVVSSFFIIVLSFLVVAIITAGYAFVLAFEAHGRPNQAEISHFAAMMSRWLMPLLEMFFTFIVAFISTKKNQNSISIHGLLIGILSGFLGTIMKMSFGGHLNCRTCIFFLILAGLGFIGGSLRQRQLARSSR
jgi:hypothetical protein